MYYYKTKIEYDGTNYAGFQWQNGIKTIQSEINSALYSLVDGKISTMSASRTDTGVHAIEQVVKISSDISIDLVSFIENFNHLLPPQIQCREIVACDGLFKPAAEATSKEYRYFFTNKTLVKKEDQKYIANISNQLDFASMQTCSQALLGLHDFCNFYSKGSNVKNTNRHILRCELSIINPNKIFSKKGLFKIPQELENCYQLRIEANGFIKQMIRHIVSALWMVGSGKISTNYFIELLATTKEEKQLWKVAPPNGLYLYQINYRKQ